MEIRAFDADGGFGAKSILCGVKAGGFGFDGATEFIRDADVSLKQDQILIEVSLCAIRVCFDVLRKDVYLLSLNLTGSAIDDGADGAGLALAFVVHKAFDRNPF